MSDTYGNSLDFYNVHSSNISKRGLYLEKSANAAKAETLRRTYEPMLAPAEVCSKNHTQPIRENFTMPTPQPLQLPQPPLPPQKICLDINTDNLIYYIFILVIAYLFYKVIVLELKLATITEKIQNISANAK